MGEGVWGEYIKDQGGGASAKTFVGSILCHAARIDLNRIAFAFETAGFSCFFGIRRWVLWLHVLTIGRRHSTLARKGRHD